MHDTITPRANELLAMLPDSAYRQLLPLLTLVPMPVGQLRSGRYPNDLVFFPVRGIVSLVVYTEDGGSAECAIAGNRGMISVSSILGTENLLEAQVQTEGHAYRMTGAALRRLFRESRPIQALLLRYFHVMMVQMAQTTICNRYHSIDQRLCRWLLLCLDSLSNQTLTMTHKGIANMMGVRRERVTEVIRRLEGDGLIMTSRARIEIKDVEQVREKSCECYRVVKERVDQLLTEGAAPGTAAHADNGSKPQKTA